MTDNNSLNQIKRNLKRGWNLNRKYVSLEVEQSFCGDPPLYNTTTTFSVCLFKGRGAEVCQPAKDFLYNFLKETSLYCKARLLFNLR